MSNAPNKKRGAKKLSSNADAATAEHDDNNAIGVTGVNSQQTTQQLGIGINSNSTTSINNIQQQEHGQEDGKSGDE